MFRRWGFFVARHARVVLIASLALLLLGAPLIPTGLGKLQAEGWVDASAESSQVATTIAQDFGQPGSTFWIVFSSPTLRATDPAFQTAVQQALAPLRSRPEVTAITDYASTGSSRFISRDGRETYVVITTSTANHDVEKAIPTYESLVKSTALTRWFGGSAPANAAFARAVESDLRTQETLSLPITLVLLVIVFGSLVAAGLPLAVGILSIPAALGGIALMAHLTDTSIYVLNIATILGLAVSIDYSLFIVTRFREELHQRPVADAVAAAMATAGKAVFFSGMIVTVGLLGMVFFPMFALRSMGVGGAVVVGLAVFYAFTFLPALLAILGPRIDRLRVRNVAVESRGDGGIWSRLASGVMRYPVAVILPVLALLIALGLPFLNANFGTPGMDMLPRTDESRLAYDALVNDFADTPVAPITVLLQPRGGAMTDAANIAAMKATYDRIAALPGVQSIDSIYSLAPSGANATSQELSALLKSTNAADQKAARGYVAASAAQLTVIGKGTADSRQAKDLVNAIRALDTPGATLTVQVGGATAINLDMVSGIMSRIPYALGFVVVVTYVLLFLLLGSVFLPFKAIVVDALSITASFGALVWIFQDGHLQHLLGFQPTGYIVPMIPVMMFCMLFGLSMDYEVLMLTRMQEEYEKTGDNTHAVATGLERTGRVITSAALIMIVVFGTGILDKLLILESMGVGMAIAVFIDASIVRALLVPATMRLMGGVNWWAPAGLKRLYARLGLGEASEAAATPAREFEHVR